MQVILREDIEKLGKIGDLVKVADGYARNFLVPTKKPSRPRPRTSMPWSMPEDGFRPASQAQERGDLGGRQDQGLSITIKAKTGEEGKLFGSVTSMDIAEAAKAQGVVIDKRKIVLAGTHQTAR